MDLLVPAVHSEQRLAEYSDEEINFITKPTTRLRSQTVQIISIGSDYVAQPVHFLTLTNPYSSLLSAHVYHFTAHIFTAGTVNFHFFFLFILQIKENKLTSLRFYPSKSAFSFFFIIK